jgi:hypothetical protein
LKDERTENNYLFSVINFEMNINSINEVYGQKNLK